MGKLTIILHLFKIQIIFSKEKIYIKKK